MNLRRIVLALLFSLGAVFGASQASFDREQNQWRLGNESIQAIFQLTPDGYFLTKEIDNLESGDRWTASQSRPTSPIRLQADNDLFDAQTPFQLVSQYPESTSPAGVRQVIVLQDLRNRALITVALEIYDNQPILRYGLTYKNLTPKSTHITWINMVPWTFDDLGKRYTALRVNQWSVASKLEDFQPLQTLLDTTGTAVEVYSGADAQQCTWLALRDSDQRGLFAGWEFDGRAKTTVRQIALNGYVQFNSTVLSLNHPVDPDTELQLPHSFLGVFHGGWDEAGYRTQRFVEAALAKPMPDAKTFPYVSWDSWAYLDKIDEVTLKRNADRAAAIGVELFTVDLGWARGIGDWYADPDKFPNGLGAVADYVHALGMKFGLHFALAEADPNSPVLKAHSDWAATDDASYFGATGLCLSHQPVQDWIVQQAIRMIDDYHVDWILQDGQNMVKQCTRTNHTHDPADSNYANSVLGINAVVSAIQTARPNVSWENCENGGQMMTFNMVRNYVTSITNDASGALPARSAVYGASFPFPPRYTERYMPATDGLTPYSTHSYRFGGPWAIMMGLTELTADQLGFLSNEIASYKSQRSDISAGKVYHLVAPGANATDAIQSYNPATDTAIAIITRAASKSGSYLLKPQGLNPAQRYTVWSEISPAVYSQPGSQLMTNGIRIPLPAPYSSEVVHIEPQQ